MADKFTRREALEILTLTTKAAAGTSLVLAGVMLTGRAIEEARQKTQEQISDFKSLVDSFYASNDPTNLEGNFYDLAKKLDEDFKLQEGQSIGIQADYTKGGNSNNIAYNYITIDKNKQGLETTYSTQNGDEKKDSTIDFLNEIQKLTIMEAGVTLISSSKKEKVEIPPSFMDLFPEETVKEINTVSVYESWSVNIDYTTDTPVTKGHNEGFALSSDGQLHYIIFQDLESADPDNTYYFATFTDINNDPDSHAISKADYDAFVNSLK